MTSLLRRQRLETPELACLCSCPFFAVIAGGLPGLTKPWCLGNNKDFLSDFTGVAAPVPLCISFGNSVH